VVEVVAKGGTKATVVTVHGLRFDLRVVPPECYGNLLQHFTGSKEHNIAMREEAQRRGLSISEYGVLVTETDETVTHPDERALYELLGYQFVPPELRENTGELEAARAGALPRLVELRDLKGDLHAHTTWSADGRATMEEMARAAIERGYSYLAVTDHSHYLHDGRLQAQDAEIDALNEAGAVPAAEGGRGERSRRRVADLSDEVLATRDWVGRRSTPPSSAIRQSASARRWRTRMWIASATDGAQIGRRPGMAVDIGQVVETALRTGTALEINSQPDSLDMPDPLARVAGESGVLVPVSSDAHRTAALGYVELGIAQARRAWLTKKQVLNARTWAQIEKMQR
jgi:DNA polymerase (family 10)